MRERKRDRCTGERERGRERKERERGGRGRIREKKERSTAIYQPTPIKSSRTNTYRSLIGETTVVLLSSVSDHQFQLYKNFYKNSQEKQGKLISDKEE